MEKLNILLCCEAGMSSGFLVQQMRGAAKKWGIMAKVEAESQNSIAGDLPKTDTLFIGPHLSHVSDELKAMCDLYAVPVLMILEDMYAGLDGKGLLASCMETSREKGQSYEYVYQLAGLQLCTKGRQGYG